MPGGCGLPGVVQFNTGQSDIGLHIKSYTCIFVYYLSIYYHGYKPNSKHTRVSMIYAYTVQKEFSLRA